MGKKTTGDFNMSQNVKVEKAAPWDDRSTVQYLSDLTGNTLSGYYKGMTVVVCDESDTTKNGLYILMDVAHKNEVSEKGWRAVANNNSIAKVFDKDLGLLPVTTMLQTNNNNFYEGNELVVTYRTSYLLTKSVGWVRFLFDNRTWNRPGYQEYTLKCSVQAMPTGSTNLNSIALQQLSFGNNASIDVFPEKYVISDPVYIGLDPINGAYLLLRACYTAAGAVAHKWPVGKFSMNGYEGAAIGDLTESGDTFNYDNNGQQFPRPFLIGSLKQEINSYAFIGDSIDDGAGDESGRGFVGILSEKYKVSLTKVGFPGETLYSFNASNYYKERYIYLEHANTIVSNYGTNDIGIGRTANELKQDYLTLFRTANRTGKKIIQLTILPRASSTDNWRTAANQTPWTEDAKRIAVNDWLRAGAPCTLSSDGYSATPAAIGSGVPCPWLEKVIDTASLMEVDATNTLTVNGGRWLVGGIITSGNASDGATYCLIDSSKNFLSLKVSGALLVVTGGTGTGQTVTIIGAATANQINFKTSLATAIDNTSTYEIINVPTADQVHPKNNYHEIDADGVFVEL